MKERLDKVLSAQGVCSRREVRDLIKNKRIKINGLFPQKSDIKTDPEHDIIELDGQPLDYRRHTYIMMNKPKGVLSASNDRYAQTVIDLLPDELKRRGLFPAGRLDKDTTGLLLITDDGELAHNMLSPKKHVYKLYRATLNGELSDEKRHILENGITLSDGTSFKPARVFVNEADRRVVEIEISEGKFHQVKKMFEFVELSVVELHRMRIGGLFLDENLVEGDCRLLSNIETSLIFSGNNN